MAGLKGYVTNLPQPSAEFVISAYHRLFQIEASLRMSKHDLAARPIYHHKRESIEAHPDDRVHRARREQLCRGTHRLVDPQVVRTARRYRTIQIRAGQQLLTAADPLPTDLREALAMIR